MVRMILKEVGGRLENAGGSIKSDSNMFEGSSGNAPSDKLGLGSGGKNPVMESSSEEFNIDETETPEVETADVDTEDAAEIMSDENLKYSKQLKGRLKNLELDPMKASGKSSGGMNIGGMANLMKGMGSFGDNADMASDMGDMADVADVASDERLKRIFGDDEDAISAFAKINAIKFIYNETAKEIPGGEKKGVDEDPHYGVKAQELAENSLTESAVKKDPISDYLEVDTKELTMANTAIISEICKRILIIEKVLGIKVV